MALRTLVLSLSFLLFLSVPEIWIFLVHLVCADMKYLGNDRELVCVCGIFFFTKVMLHETHDLTWHYNLSITIKCMALISVTCILCTVSFRSSVLFWLCQQLHSYCLSSAVVFLLPSAHINFLSEPHVWKWTL